MAKKRSTKKPPFSVLAASFSYPVVRYGIGCSLVAFALLVGIGIGRAAIPAARQAACVLGAQGAVGVITGGQRAPEDQISSFCKELLSK